MSCHLIQNRGQSSDQLRGDIDPCGSKFDSYAPLDTAYDSSIYMNDFQNKLSQHNPLLQKMVNDKDQSDGLIISQQSEEKLNKNIDEIIGSLYRNEQPICDKQSIPNKNKSIPILNPFDPRQQTDCLLDYANMTSYTLASMNIFKFILLVILIILLIYGIFLLYNDNSNY